jgi:hypothetical protein
LRQLFSNKSDQGDIVKKLITTLFLLATAGICTLPAAADTLTLVSNGGQIDSGEYVYPYNFSINGSSNLTPLMCLQLARTVSIGESWNVTESGIPLDSSQTSIDYRALAILTFEAEGDLGGFSLGDYQYAVWSVFDPTDMVGNPGYTPEAQALSAAALAAAVSGNPSNLPGFSYSNFVVYTPTSDTTGWTNGIPQEFLGNVAPTPEPSSLLLLGTGVLGLAGIMGRKRVKA